MLAGDIESFLISYLSRLFAEKSIQSLSLLMKLSIFCGMVSVQTHLFSVLPNGRYYKIARLDVALGSLV